MVAGAWGGQIEDPMLSEPGALPSQWKCFGVHQRRFLSTIPSALRGSDLIKLIYGLAVDPSDPTHCTCPSLT